MSIRLKAYNKIINNKKKNQNNNRIRDFCPKITASGRRGESKREIPEFVKNK